MDAIYNVDFGVNNCHSNCPREIYDKTVEFLHEKGLLGIKQISKYGEIAEGYDRDCKNFRKAFFDVHYNAHIDASASEMLEELSLTSSSENDLAQRTIELGEAALEIAETIDPSIRVLPWNIYTSFPICSSLEIVTPAGRQSLHYHTEDRRDFGVMQLWKPEKENKFYVLDELKRTLGDLSTKEFEVYEALRVAREGFHPIQILKIKSRLRSLKKSSKVYKQFFLNPDQIKKFPNFIKDLC